jgi:prepilin-type N-terminal cleavage/methylation domain-containing protein
MKRTTSAFTIIELLVVISIIALLVGILLPAIGKAREQAKLTQSETNMRNLATAHQSYAAAWSDRQFTLVVDSLSSYGSDRTSAFTNYHTSLGGCSSANDPGCHEGRSSAGARRPISTTRRTVSSATG